MDPLSPQELRELLQFMRQFRQQAAPLSSTPTLPVAPPVTPVDPQPATNSTPVAQTGETHRQVPETPIIHRYQTPRSAPAPLMAPSSYQPFLGMSTLAPSAATLNTGHANQERMLSANAVLPRGPSLVLVYPPHDPEAPDQTYYVYRLLATDFLDHLEANHLAYRYELPLSMLVNELLARVVADMTASASAYTFHAARRAGTGAAITTLQPLALISKGRVYHNQVRARVQPIIADMTIGNLAADRNRFAGDVCIADGRFIIRLAVMAFPLVGLGNGRRHTCISNRMYSLFPRDADGMGSDLEETSGGESTDDGEVARQLWPARLNRAPIVQTAGPSTGRATRATSASQHAQIFARRSPPLPPTRPITPVNVFIAMPLPASIWDENSTFDAHSTCEYSDHRFLNTVFQAATRGLPNRELHVLRVRGRDVDGAADHFSHLLDAAGRRGDYTDFLVPEQAFSLSTDHALGEGLQQEVMYTVLRRYLNREPAWFHRGAGDFLTLRTMFPSSVPVPAQRLTEAKRLGAICGLLMVFGQSPAPISPAIFQYIVHGGNLHSLPPSFISEWFSELRLQLLEFHAMGPDDDLTPFQSHLITYLNVEASAFQPRDLATHLSLGVVLLFRPTLADTTFDHPELKSFAEGFLLPCRNGFNLGEAIRNFEGGSDAFFSLIATSYISSADSVLPNIQPIAPPLLNTWIAALREHTGDITLTFNMLVERFLRGTGTPCPVQFQAARGAFHPIVDLSRIDTPGFRSQALVWAATGSPFINPTQGRIFFGPVATDDSQYDAIPANRERLAANGTFLFRTCVRTVMYPVDYVLHLAQARYSPESEPADFQEAFDFWMLRQCLLGIGRHNLI
ncbi:hypothetical protein MVEN_02001000 [Mycena venus]|uniref:Uncharacterized protein n=1 Tax=Mycena venus TaxID=2733690 RepID=A0A8H6XEU2_9AGAR|nr:hypothetical protein MVEN_02001000 [Mycena venus]